MRQSRFGSRWPAIKTHMKSFCTQYEYICTLYSKHIHNKHFIPASGNTRTSSYTFLTSETKSVGGVRVRAYDFAMGEMKTNTFIHLYILLNMEYDSTGHEFVALVWLLAEYASSKRSRFSLLLSFCTRFFTYSKIYQMLYSYGLGMFQWRIYLVAKFMLHHTEMSPWPVLCHVHSTTTSFVRTWLELFMFRWMLVSTKN